MRVKICGITRREDARAAVDAGADALGFVFATKSPRVIPAAAVPDLTRDLPPAVARVGLFVNATPAEIESTIAVAGLDTIQLHGEESAALASSFLGRVRVLKAFRIRAADSLRPVMAYAGACDAVLLDAFHPAAHGGTGTQFDWSLADAIRVLGLRVVIAGGLRPDNVAEAVERFASFAVDVSSGVEQTPGRKDPAKVLAFIQAAKRKDPPGAPGLWQGVPPLAVRGPGSEPTSLRNRR